MSATAGQPAGSWDTQAERGSLWIVRFMVWLTMRCGWHVAYVLLFPITAYFFATSRAGRAASRQFLTVARGRPVGPLTVFRHLFIFSSVILDRLFFVTEKTGAYRIRIHGLEHLHAAIDPGGGCVLLGAHVGSFEALRAIAADCPVKANPLMYSDNAGALTGLLDRLNPDLSASVIRIGTVDAMMRARAAVERGEMVGILADRAPVGGKFVTVPFMGRPAEFPVGPMVLASLLGAPAVLFFGLRTGPRRYDIHFEPFAPAVTLRREARQEDLRYWIGRYAERVAARSREHPFNWFNFYDFWGTAAHDPSDAAADAGLRPGGLPGARGSG